MLPFPFFTFFSSRHWMCPIWVLPPRSHLHLQDWHLHPLVQSRLDGGKQCFYYSVNFFYFLVILIFYFFPNPDDCGTNFIYFIIFYFYFISLLLLLPPPVPLQAAIPKNPCNLIALREAFEAVRTLHRTFSIHKFWFCQCNF